MNLQRQTAVLAALLVLSHSAGLAEIKPLEIKWSELAPIVVDRHVELTLTDGERVKGEAVVVREDVIVMNVSSSSGEKSIEGQRVDSPGQYFIDQGRKDARSLGPMQPCWHELPWKRNCGVSWHSFGDGGRRLRRRPADRPPSHPDQDRPVRR
jgi:hypothetical protein